MSEQRVYILGGYQTDFQRHFGRENLGVFELMRETMENAMSETSIDPSDIEVAHVGNFAAELFCGQGQLGGLFAAIDPTFSGVPSSRHEAACASGSIAALAAQSDIKAGHYDLACVLGVELMRHISVQEAADNLAAAAWIGHEGEDAQYMWPYMFAKVGDEYERRYGLKYDHLSEIAKLNFENARVNPNAQTRDYTFVDDNFTEDDEANPKVEGRIRKTDCGQVTDGGACIFLASEKRAKQYADEHGIDFDEIPYIQGWGHRTATIRLSDKLKESHNNPYVMPHVRGAITDAYERAGIGGSDDLDLIETHDCFTTTEYMAIDHFGITKPGESWKAVEDGTIAKEGATPINPSGGLIGCGHPVGSTGVRMLLDAYKQLTGKAGDYQIGNAKTAGTLNIGGSATTTVSFVVTKEAA